MLKNKKNVLKNTENFFKKLGVYLDELKKHRDRDSDDLDYKKIRSIEYLFDEINEDYYKPVKTKSAFNNNYIEYESRGHKDENLSPKEYLDMIRPYLRDMINNHKEALKFTNPTGKIIEDKTFGEWKIQLTMQSNFISSLDTGEIRTVDSKSKNLEIFPGSEIDDIMKNFWNLFCKDTRKD